MCGGKPPHNHTAPRHMTIADLFAAQLDEMAEADRRYQGRTTATLARIREILDRHAEAEAEEAAQL